MRNYSAFDRDYWEYAGKRWQDAYLDFYLYCEELQILQDLFYDSKFKDIQIAIFMEFVKTTGVPFRTKKLNLPTEKYYDVKSDNKNISGLIYEWLNEYSEMKGYRELKPKPAEAIIVKNYVFYNKDTGKYVW